MIIIIYTFDTTSSQLSSYQWMWLIFSVLLYVGLLASFSLNVTLLLRKPLPPPTMSNDNHGENHFLIITFTFWPLPWSQKKVLYCPPPEPPPLPLWGAWVQPPQLKGASPTQPHALSQVNKIFKGGSSRNILHKCEILFISPPPGRVFTQCQFLPELNLWELPRGNGSPSKTNTHPTKQWWKHKKTVNHKHRVMWLTKQQ